MEERSLRQREEQDRLERVAGGVLDREGRRAPPAAPRITDADLMREREERSAVDSATAAADETDLGIDIDTGLDDTLRRSEPPHEHEHEGPAETVASGAGRQAYDRRTESDTMGDDSDRRPQGSASVEASLRGLDEVLDAPLGQAWRDDARDSETHAVHAGHASSYHAAHTAHARQPQAVGSAAPASTHWGSDTATTGIGREQGLAAAHSAGGQDGKDGGGGGALCLVLPWSGSKQAIDVDSLPHEELVANICAAVGYVQLLRARLERVEGARQR